MKIKKIAIFFSLISICIFWLLTRMLIFVGLENSFLSFLPQFTLAQHLDSVNLPRALWVLANFDGVNYVEAARVGYDQFNLGFFPLYPLLVHFVHSLTSLPYFVSGLFISHIAWILAMWVILQLYQPKMIKDSKMKFVLCCLLFPTTFFWGNAYNDSLFLLFSSLTLLLGQHKRWWAAGIFAFLATLTRLNGVALSVYLFFEYLLQHHANLFGRNKSFKLVNFLREVIIETKSFLKAQNLKISFAICSPWLAFGSYLLYVQKSMGDYALLFSSMSTWGQDKMIFPLQTVYRYGKILIFADKNTLVYFVAVLELISLLFYIYLLIFARGKISISQWWFLLISLLIPALTGTFQGMPRYALHLAPFFWVWYEWIKSFTFQVRVFLIALLLFLQLVLFVFYTHGYFVA